MRELRFRAWAEISTKEWLPDVKNFKKEHRMLHVHTIHLNTEKVIITSEFGVHSMPFSKVELMQYTGLKDINGKDVYEGDIVKVDRKDSYRSFNKALVVYEGCCGAFLLQYSKKARVGGILFQESLHNTDGTIFGRLTGWDIEVIGNNYE